MVSALRKALFKNWGIRVINLKPIVMRPANHSRTSRRMLSTITVALFLSGCALQQPVDYSRNADFRVASRWSGFSKSEPHMVDDGWLRSFGSKNLEALVAEALINNRDLRTAAARVAESRARVKQSRAASLPSATGRFDASVENEIDSIVSDRGAFKIGVEVKWEADIWGRIRGNRAAASLDAVSQTLLFEYTRQSIAAQVTESWIIVNANKSLVGIARTEARVRSGTLEYARARVAEHTALTVDKNRAAANLAVTKARVAFAQARLLESIRTLEVILGRYPDAKTEVYESRQRLPKMVGTGLPSELLERRPDVIAAERKVAAAFYRRNEAKAAQLPRLTITGDLTGTGRSVGKALDPKNIVWSIAGGILAPIFNGGKLKEEVVIATARQDAALANYGAVALGAFKEVEDGLSNQRLFQNQLSHLYVAEREYRAAIRSDEARYKAGEVDLFRYSDTQLDYYNVQRSIVNARKNYLTNRVRLHLALGGSFEPVKPEKTADTSDS